MRQFFITGTDTDVGKTVASTALVNAFVGQGLRTVGHKPISAGCEQTEHGLRNEDAQLLIAQSNVELPYDIINPFAFREPIAPHITAQRTNQVITEQGLLDNYHELSALAVDVLISEGAGGWLLPINQDQVLPDIVQQLSMPIILVVGMRLGCLNHALLTQQAIIASGCHIAGWIANAPEQQPFFKENLTTLQARIKAPLLGVIPTVNNASEAARYLNISLLD